MYEIKGENEQSLILYVLCTTLAFLCFFLFIFIFIFLVFSSENNNFGAKKILTAAGGGREKLNLRFILAELCPFFPFH